MRGKLLTGLLGLSLLATLPSSTNYQLNSYGIGPGGTNNSASSTYQTQSNLGEASGTTSSGSTYTAKSGAVQAEQLAVPGAPTLSNGSGSYYNKLALTINTSGNPSDATYSVAVSTDNFVTIFYVQADGTLGASRVYQTYSLWGGASGSFIVGLSDNTTYEAKVDAKQALYTNTAYGAAASTATSAPSISFAVSPNSTSLSNLLPATVVTSSDITLNFATNAASGGGVYVSGQNTGLSSARDSYTISAFTGDLSVAGQGFGVQVASATQTSGGPFTAVSPYNGSGSTVGAEALAPKQLAGSNTPVTGGSATTKLKAKAATLTPAAADYQETLTFVAAASF